MTHYAWQAAAEKLMSQFLDRQQYAGVDGSVRSFTAATFHHLPIHHAYVDMGDRLKTYQGQCSRNKSWCPAAQVLQEIYEREGEVPGAR